MDPAEARRQALIEFGGVEPTRERCERQRPAWWIGTVVQDLHYASRGFGRNPLFTIIVVLTLALGIGATTGVFSVVDRIMFRPLPYPDAGRIVSLGFVHSLEQQEFVMGRFYVEWEKEQTPFTAMSAQSTGVHNCDLVENDPMQLSCIFIPGELPSLARNLSGCWPQLPPRGGSSQGTPCGDDFFLDCGRGITTAIRTSWTERSM